MAPTVNGSVVEVNSSTGTSSASVTIPAGTNLLLVFASYFKAQAFTSMTLAGAGLTQELSYTNSNHWNQATWFIANPATGSQTFAWVLTGGNPDNGIIFQLVPIADADVSGDPTSGSATTGGADPATTGSFTSTVNDLVVGGGTDSSAVNAGYGADQTEIYDAGTFNGVGAAVGTKPGVVTSTTFAVDGTDGFLVVGAVSVKGTAGGAAPVWPFPGRVMLQAVNRAATY